MEKKEFAFSFEVYGSADELNRDDAALLRQAREATKRSYAPYSRFRVGAAARLLNGELVTGAKASCSRPPHHSIPAWRSTPWP
jgi:cytidine deaminase